NISIITLEFDWGSNLDEASNNIRDALSRAQPLLPDDVDDPVIFRFNSSSIPVVILAATAGESYPNLRQILDDQLVTPLNRVPGVGEVNCQGGHASFILTIVEPQNMTPYSIPTQQISQKLTNEHPVISDADLTLRRQK